MTKAKLTPAEVSLLRRIWALGKLTQSELAGVFGIDRGQVSRVVRGRSWGPMRSVPLVLQRVFDAARKEQG